MRLVLPLLAAATCACSSLTDSGDGVVALDVKLPSRLQVEVGDTVVLSAVALDRSGAPVAAGISWLTPDTTIGVVAGTGQITGRIAGTTGRVQAAEGTLVSDFLTFTVLGRADSLALPSGAAVTVAPGATSSPALAVRLIGPAPDSLAGHRIIFSISAPAFADPAARTIQFPNGALADTVLTAADGTPVTPVTLDRVAGVSAPASASVEVRALHPSGTPIAGSGQTFAVTFQ